MIKCLDCGAENIEGMLYCDECGAELNDYVPSEEDSSEDQMMFPLDGPSLKLIINSTGEEILLPEKEEIIIGREDPVSAIFPDVDTTNCGGEDDGVSRKHARITKQGEDYFIEDLNSVNSTFLNKMKLDPETPSPITNGDELMLGRLKFNIAVS
jgi:pSer/pThr/pTyr-binding forkhead associated (FHA) protein